MRPRGAAGPPPPHTAERGLGRGGTALPEPRPSPPPESPAPPSFPSALGATAIALSATCLLRELRSGRPRHGGVLRPDHVAAATPESPRGPEATAQPFLRPGHGQPRRPPVCGAARGTRSGAREGGGRRGAGGRPGTEPGTQRTLAGCAAPPGGRAWSGARVATGLLLGGGRAMKPSRDGRTRCAAGSCPALVTLSSESLGLGRSEVWSLRCWVPGWRRPEAQAHCPLLPPPQVTEGGPARETLQLLEVPPRKRLTAGPEQDPCGSRPAPEGAGAGAEQGHSAGGGGWCRHCHTKLAELKRQAWKLVGGPGTPLRVSDPSSGRPVGRVLCWNLGVFRARREARFHRGFGASPFPSLGLGFPSVNTLCVSWGISS